MCVCAVRFTQIVVWWSKVVVFVVATTRFIFFLRPSEGRPTLFVKPLENFRFLYHIISSDVCRVCVCLICLLITFSRRLVVVWKSRKGGSDFVGGECVTVMCGAEAIAPVRGSEEETSGTNHQSRGDA